MYNNDPQYMNSSQAGLGSLLASRGRNGDSVLVHMAPEEVQGLQSLALAHGGSLTINPETGLYEASFLKKILPMVAGAFLGPAGLGMSAFATAATVGGITGLIEGDLKKGLMAGLGAYSGANITGALKQVGTPAAQPETPSTVVEAPPPTPKFGPASTKDQIMFGGQAPRTFDVDPLARQNWAASNTPTGAAPIQAQTTIKPSDITAPTTKFGTVMQGARNVFTGQEGAGGKFMDALGSPISKYATFAGAMIPFAEEPKPINVPGMGENIVYIPGGFNPQYGTGADQPPQLPGKYYKRTAQGLVPYNPFQMAPGARGFAVGGPVQAANQDMNMPMPYPHPNQNYPLSTVVKANYSPQYLSNVPQPREVLSGYDTKVDPFTGEEKFAEGGDVKEDPNVVANRKYVEELNRRALNPVNNPYGLNFAAGTSGAGGLGGTNTPWTGLSPYGTQIQSGVSGGEMPTGGTADVAMNLAAMYGVQKGLGSLMGTQTAKNLVAGAKSALGLGGGAATTGAATTGAATTGAATTGAAATPAAGTSTAGTGSKIFSEAQKQFTDWLGKKGFDNVKLPSGPVGYATAALGAYNTAKAIEQGKEGKAALNAALTAAQFGGPMVAAAAAAIAAIGASLVNTEEQGDIALRNYWKAVDQGRGLGSAPPEELANGFINFYRTNKNNFAGQERYGRKGNEDFVYDLTQVVNKAVETGLVSKNASAGEIYQRAVQPWLNSMGSGPQNEDARRIQDFMMTDLIHNFMQGKPISNAQVKGDKKFKIVSQKPVFAGTAVSAPSPVKNTIIEEPQYASGMDAQSPYGVVMPFADGGAIGDDYNFGFAGGGLGSLPEYKAGGKLLDGPGDGMSDDIPAVIRGKGVQRAALADGEFVIPADVVSHLGNGSTKAGAKKLYQMMAQVRKARTGKTRQAPAVKTDRFLPA
jgi:hypothetical protein